jgi:zinc D-Ala-D-Ala carboxypeptidase
MTIKLTPHFTLEELTVSEAAARNGWDNTPHERETANLIRLARLLERVKVLSGNKPIMVNSAFRSKRVNEAVGGKPTSQHCFGCAADIRIPSMTPDQVVRMISMSNLEYDQVISEFGSWTHISVPNTADTAPRKQALIIDKAGTRPFK